MKTTSEKKCGREQGVQMNVDSVVPEGFQLKAKHRTPSAQARRMQGQGMAGDDAGDTNLCEQAAPAAGAACCCGAVIQLEHQAGLRNSNKGTHGNSNKSAATATVAATALAAAAATATTARLAHTQHTHRHCVVRHPPPLVNRDADAAVGARAHHRARQLRHAASQGGLVLGVGSRGRGNATCL